MTVPNQFANVTTSIPLSQLDANFNTPITLGNTAIQLGNTVTTLNNMTLANVTISSGNVTITNVSVTTANVTTANITTAIIGTANVTTANVTTGIIGTANVTTGNITTAVITTANVATANITTSQILNYGTANSVVYLNSSKAATANTGLQFDGTNLGLGVTPNALVGLSSYRTFDIGTTAGNGLLGGPNDVQVVTNAYYNSGWKYAATGASARYAQNVGGHYWFQATSGTAGNAITWTQAMTLDTSGRLGVNETSPASQIHINGNADNYFTAGYRVNRYTTAGQYGTINYANGLFNIVATDTALGGPTIAFRTSTDGSTTTERARITSDGYFKATASGSYVGVSLPYYEFISTASGQQIIYSRNSSANPYGMIVNFSGATPNNTTNWFLYCEDSTNVKCYIYSSGTISNRTGTYNAISDLKLKQDIVDASSQWDDIKALRVVKYRLKDEVAADPNYPSYIGLIAQEVEQISPGLVDNCPDMEEVEVVDEDGNVTTERRETGTVTKSVKSSIVYMKAVKALQEAMSRIEQLEAKVAALESA